MYSDRNVWNKWQYMVFTTGCLCWSAEEPITLSCGPSLRQHQYLRLNRCSVKHSQSHCLVPEQILYRLFALGFMVI